MSKVIYYKNRVVLKSLMTRDNTVKLKNNTQQTCHGKLI